MPRVPVRLASRVVHLSAILGLLCCGTALAGDEAPDMQAMMAAAEPGPHHAAMMSRAGTWKTTSKMWMQPGAEPMVSTGTSTMKAALGGRFLEEAIHSPDMMGQPWEGRGVFGYDNSSKKHIATWYDSFGTMMMSFEGTCADHCNKITLTSTFFDPSTQSEQTMKTVYEQQSNDKGLVTLYMVADGNDIKTGEIVYERTGK